MQGEGLGGIVHRSAQFYQYAVIAYYHDSDRIYLFFPEYRIHKLSCIELNEGL